MDVVWLENLCRHALLQEISFQYELILVNYLSLSKLDHPLALDYPPPLASCLRLHASIIRAMKTERPNPYITPFGPKTSMKEEKEPARLSNVPIAALTGVLRAQPPPIKTAAAKPG